jgi:hypothetical protein
LQNNINKCSFVEKKRNIGAKQSAAASHMPETCGRKRDGRAALASLKLS